ncbi:MAG: ATP-binding protein [Fibrobacterales bacterium]
MIEKIKHFFRWLAEVKTEDPLQAPRDSAINVLIIFFLGATVILQFLLGYEVFVLGKENPGFWVNMFTLSLYILYFVLYKKGYRRTSFTLILIYFIVIMIDSEFTYGNLFNAFFAYLVIALAGLFFNIRVSFGILCLYLGTIVLTRHLESTGSIPPFKKVTGHELILWSAMIASAILVMIQSGLYTHNMRIAIQNELARKKELEQQRENLEKMVMERTKHLLESNGQLEESRNEIERLHERLKNEYKEQHSELEEVKEKAGKVDLISGMNEITSSTLHNVKNIINSINLSIEQAKKIEEGDAVQALYKATDMLRTNINSIEDFIVHDSRGKKLMEYYLAIEEMFEEEIEYHKRSVDNLIKKVDSMNSIITTQQVYSGVKENDLVSIEGVVDDALQILATSLEAIKISVNKQFGAVPKIEIHKVKLVHVLVNLIKNAIEAIFEAEEGFGTITISTEKIDDSIVLKISDNGPGILESDQSNLFESGFSTKSDGHGFGLSSSKRYLEEMGARISVESTPQLGTTFRIFFSPTISDELVG